MSFTPVETIVSKDELYSNKFLADVPFEPGQRGTLMGLIARLKNEPVVAEDDMECYTFLGRKEEANAREQTDWWKTGYYKRGVSPSERVETLQMLFRILFRVQGHESAQRLLMAVHEELTGHDINMFDMVAIEDQEAKLEAARRKQARAEWDAGRAKDQEGKVALAD